MHNGGCWVCLEKANHPFHHRWAGLPNRDVSHAGSSHTETSAEPESLDRLGEVHWCVCVEGLLTMSTARIMLRRWGMVFSDEVPNWMMKLINISRTELIIVTSVVCGPALPNRSIPLASCIP
jgi:hypothetical protein